MYIITSKTRRLLRRDPKYQAAVQHETRALFKECGVERAIPVTGQTPEEQLEQVKANKAKIADTMAASREENRRKAAEKKKAREKQVAQMIRARGQEFAEKHRAKNKPV